MNWWFLKPLVYHVYYTRYQFSFYLWCIGHILTQQTLVGLQDVFSTSSAFKFFFFKTSSTHFARRLGRPKIITLKTSWKRLEDMSWRRLKNMSWSRLQEVLEIKKCLLGISVSNKAKCVSKKSMFHKS